MLKQIAARLHGTFHNGNDKQLASSLITDATGTEEESVFEKLGRREYALIAIGLASLILASLPFLLHFLGTRWRPGRRGSPARTATLQGGFQQPRRPAADGEVAWGPVP